MTSSHLVAVPVTTVWTAPDAPRESDGALVVDAPDLAGWCTTHNREDRLGLHGRVVTQALMGEPADVIGEQPGWLEVVLPWQPSSLDERGYPGWVPAAHLTPAYAGQASSDGVAAVRPLTATLRLPGGGVEVSCGTVLAARRRDGSEVAVALPDGGEGWLDAADVVRRAGPFTAAPDPVVVAATARHFLGMSYLWGGTSGWGVDCSGLVHLAHRVHGVTVPRDASDQQAALTPVELADVRAHDLLFFARPDEPAYHVGFVTLAGPVERLRMLHAPESGELVEDAPLAAERLDTLVGAARGAPSVRP